MRTVTVDARQRVRLPEVKPGQVFAYKPNADGTIKLVPVIVKPGPKRIVARLVKRGNDSFFRVPKGFTLDPDAIGKAVAQERGTNFIRSLRGSLKGSGVMKAMMKDRKRERMETKKRLR